MQVHTAIENLPKRYLEDIFVEWLQYLCDNQTVEGTKTYRRQAERIRHEELAEYVARHLSWAKRLTNMESLCPWGCHTIKGYQEANRSQDA